MTEITSGERENDTRGRGGLLILTGMFLLGVFAGASVLAADSSGTIGSDRLEPALNAYIAARADFGTAFMNTFFGGMLFIAACFLLGTSFISQPLLIAVPFLKGAGHGVTMAYLYSMGDGSGVLLSLAVVLPSAAVTSLAVILAAREGIRMSCRLFSSAVVGNAGSPRNIKAYLARFLVLTVMTAAAACVDGVITLLLSDFLSTI